MSIESRLRVSIDKTSFKEVGEEYIKLQMETFGLIQAIRTPDTCQTEGTTTSLFSRFQQIYLNIIDLNKLVRQLQQITQNQPRTVKRYTEQNRKFLDEVEELAVKQKILAENNAPFETVQLAMLRIKVKVELNITNFAEVRTALSKIVDQCEQLTQPIPDHFIRYILEFERREISELERSCPEDIPIQQIFYGELRARVEGIGPAK